MPKRYSYEQIKARMLRDKKVMLSSNDNLLALRELIYRLKKEGFVINRIGKRGNIKGYQLTQAPGDCKQ